jgi:ankyrin repeat protein
MLRIHQKCQGVLMRVLAICAITIPTVIFTSCASPPSLDRAIRNSDTEELRNLITNGNENLNKNITWKINLPTEGRRRGQQIIVTTCPLIQAVQRCNKEVVDILLEEGANPDGVDLASVTPLYAATFESGLIWVSKEKGIRTCDKRIIHSLLDHGADVNKRINGTILLITKKGINDLIFMANREAGVYLNIDAYFQKEATPLHMATRQGLNDIALLYLEKGAAVDARNDLGWTSLHLAARKGNLKMAKLLIEHGADIDAKDIIGETPLMMTAERGKLELAQFLISQGSDANAKDNKGKTALDYARKRGHQDLIDLLIKH